MRNEEFQNKMLDGLKQSFQEQLQIQGFSKLSKLKKIDYLAKNFFSDSKNLKEKLMSFLHQDEALQKVFDEFSENTITNFYMPYGVVPNFKLNNKIYCVPMVIEESSVVAACAKSANFWFSRGGFKAETLSTNKVGQIHLSWKGESSKLFKVFEDEKENLLEELTPFTKNMQERGGGILSCELLDLTHLEKDYFQILMNFETCSAMGANFINTILEMMGRLFKDKVLKSSFLDGTEKDLQIIMAILSNFTPECRVKVWASCPIENLQDKGLEMSPYEFAEKFQKAMRIAQVDVYRATTHNKGIFNGVDAVVLATGNDFRAVEACGHTYASRSGQYRALSECEISDGEFCMKLELPLSLGTIGGLTGLHPMAKISLDLLGYPEAAELMQIAAGIGLAQNFAALKSLTTSGIQKGHMKMHLMNILNHLEATESERKKAREYFEEKVISFKEVREFLACERKIQ